MLLFERFRFQEREIVNISVIVRHAAQRQNDVTRISFTFGLRGCVEYSKSTRLRCRPYRHSGLRNLSHENKQSQNLGFLLCFNARHCQRWWVYFCCEKRAPGVY